MQEMETLCPDESVLAKMKRVIVRKLVEGHEAATQLQLLLQKPFGADDDEGSLSVDELVANVQRSFTESLSVLTSSSSGENGSPAAAVAAAVGASGNDDAGECRKRSTQTTKNGGRGCYQRRRSAESWTIVSPTADDNHAWRKYGQKDVLNSKFPRSYYRCTRKYDQGCRATKQVQMTQENPEMYLTSYIGIHTCKATSKTSPLVMDSNTSFLVNSYPYSKLLNEQDHPPSPMIKQEHSKEDMTPRSFDTDFHMLDSTLWSGFEGF